MGDFRTVAKIFQKYRSEKTSKSSSKSKDKISQQDTKPLSEAGVSKGQSSHAGYEPPQFIVGVGQSVGKHRSQNEDAIFTLTTNFFSYSANIPFGLYMVADGMGGHQYGEKASEVTIREMAKTILGTIDVALLNHPSNLPDQSLQHILDEGIRAAHRAVIKEAPGGGSTITAVLLIGEQMTTAHVGDSRAYLIYPDGHSQAITQDHSLVNQLVQEGKITAEQASFHPQRNVLYRALGQAGSIEAEIISEPIPFGSFLMICSDGLWGVVSEKAMVEVILSSEHPAKACQSLVDLANNAGGPDNISVVLIHLAA
jgi:serine/threonine protein phosphatase PrpC